MLGAKPFSDELFMPIKINSRTLRKVISAFLLCTTFFAMYAILFRGVIPSANHFKANDINLKALKQLPIGSNQQLVEKFLIDNSIEHGLHNMHLEWESAVKKNEFSPDELSGFYESIIRDTCIGAIVSCHTQFFFFMGPDGKLVKYVMRNGYDFI